MRRRSLFPLGAGLLAAPALLRPGLAMPVKVWTPPKAIAAVTLNEVTAAVRAALQPFVGMAATPYTVERMTAIAVAVVARYPKCPRPADTRVWVGWDGRATVSMPVTASVADWIEFTGVYPSPPWFSPGSLRLDA